MAAPKEPASSRSAPGDLKDHCQCGRGALFNGEGSGGFQPPVGDRDAAGAWKAPLHRATPDSRSQLGEASGPLSKIQMPPARARRRRMGWPRIPCPDCRLSSIPNPCCTAETQSERREYPRSPFFFLCVFAPLRESLPWPSQISNPHLKSSAAWRARFAQGAKTPLADQVANRVRSGLEQVSSRAHQLTRQLSAAASGSDRNDPLARISPIQSRAGMNVELARKLRRNAHLITFGKPCASLPPRARPRSTRGRCARDSSRR